MFIIIFLDVDTKNVLCLKNEQNINVKNMTEKHTCHSTVLTDTRIWTKAS